MTYYLRVLSTSADCVPLDSLRSNLEEHVLVEESSSFTNEDGYHILWQFRDFVEGSWWMAVLQAGTWMHFQMDLSNIQHREVFFQGTIPDGVIPR